MDIALDQAAVRWSEPLESIGDRRLIVLLHGLGSNEDDLFGLAPLLPQDSVIASVRAPLPWGPGWAWFPVTPDGPAPGSVAAATDALAAWIDGLGAPRVDLLGFSQGGAMALELLRCSPRRYGRTVVLAGFVARPEAPGDAAVTDAHSLVFWGRGEADAVIDQARVAATAEWLAKYADADIRTYRGLTHSVSEQELADVVAFLNGQSSL